ncbi:MAG TPA: hypothetical protein VEG39_02955 [Clostridia bacterium]|nr:hypothetical protein [Clostridia bacterium]
MKKAILIMVICLLLIPIGCSAVNNAAEEAKPLSAEDFVINYNGFEFDDTYPINDLVNTSGISKGDLENNSGLVSEGPKNGYKRWRLSYPESDKPQLRLVIMGYGLSPSEGDCIASAALSDIATSRGIKAGDPSDKVISAYGKPDDKVKGEAVPLQYVYVFGSKRLVLDIDKSGKVVGITYDYNIKKSFQDQGFNE